ncbi:MAG TPA: ABC transporter permease [Candidatus Elarobacter sp.]|jgi:NitT/TauT family transport system permease protein
MRGPTRPVDRRAVAAIQAAIVALALVLWEAGARAHVVDPFFVSQPSQIVETLGSWWQNHYILRDVTVTLEETLLGLAVGGVLGIALAVILAPTRWLAAIFVPFLLLANAIPRVTLIPLFLLWFGLTTIQSKVVSAVALVVFVVFFATYDGIRDVDPTLVASVRVLGAKPLDVMRHVLLPSALTWIFSSLRSAVGFALIGAVVAEYFGAQAGVGYRIQFSESQLNTSGVFAGLFVLMVLVFVINLFFQWLQRRLVVWKPVD